MNEQRRCTQITWKRSHSSASGEDIDLYDQLEYYEEMHEMELGDARYTLPDNAKIFITASVAHGSHKREK